MKIAIVGAGLSGTNLYRLLKSKAFEVMVFEKSRGAGGRCSTRYIEDKLIDHGTPFFKATHPLFEDFCNTLVEKNILTKQEQYYYPTQGMNKICSTQIQKQDLLSQTKIISAVYKNKKWELSDENQNKYDGFDVLILTIPAPQILQMNINLDEKIMHSLENIKYDSIATLMVYSHAILNLNNPALHNNKHFKKIIDNSMKYNYENFSSYVFHLNEKISNEKVFTNKEEVQEYMIDLIDALCGEKIEEDFHIISHLWKYAFVSQRLESEYLYDKKTHLGICGDFFKFKDLEGSFLSSFKLFENEF